MKKKAIILTALSFVITMHHLSAQVKKILVEEYTATWCGWCPYGALVLDSLQKYHPGKIVPMTMHDIDVYTIPEVPPIGKALNVKYMPSITIDRHYWGAPTSDIALGCTGAPDLSSFSTQALAVKASCAVTLTNVAYNSSTQLLSVTVTANFTAADSGDIRLNLFLTEDSILTKNIQVNDDNANPGSYFYMKGNPLPVWYQNHVCRAMAGGQWGTAGVVPSKVKVNDSFSKTYSVSVSPTYNFKYLNIIGVVQKYSNTFKTGTYGDTTYYKREIVNCEIAQLPSLLTTGLQPIQQAFVNIQISPNPATENCTIHFTLDRSSKTQIEVFNTLGEKVAGVLDKELEAGDHLIPWTPNLTNGLYYMAVTINGERTVSKLVLSK